ncbi:hypothetical protein WDU94_013828 [Cyamophila willieti]
MGMLADIASTMKISITETPNTKADIKRGVNDIFSIMKKLERTSKRLESEQSSQKITEVKTLPTVEEVVLQITNEIRQMTSAAETRTEEKIGSLVNRDWPDGTFSRVSLCAGAPDPTVVSSVIIIIDEQENSKLLELMVRKNPDLQMILDEGIEVGEFKFIENIAKSSTGVTHTKRTFLSKVRDEMSLIKLLSDIVQASGEGHTTKSYKIVVTDSIEWIRARKVLEIAAYFGDLQIEMHVPRGKMEGNKQPPKNYSTATKSREKPKAVHVKINDINKPVEDIVNEMKQKIDVDKLGIKVKTIKTDNQNGTFKIITKGKNDSEALNELARQIQVNFAGVSAKSETHENSIIIRNIDTVTSTKQVAAAVGIRLGREASEFESKINLKPNYRRNAQVAILRLNDEDLLKLGKTFRLGWTECTVEKIVVPKRCHNCRAYGHIARDCAQEKFEIKGICRRCNQSGHNSKSCNNEAQCRDCNVNGHISGTMACQKYRNLVREAKQTPRRNRGKMKSGDSVRRLAIENTSVSSDNRNRKMSMDDDQE